MKNIKQERKNKRDVKEFFEILFIVFCVLSILFIQIVNFYYVYIKTTNTSNIFRFIYDFSKICMIIYILLRKDSATYKLSWLIVIAIVPVLGLVLYQIFGNSNFSKKRIRKMKNISKNTQDYLKINGDVLDEIDSWQAKKEFKFLYNMIGYPIYKNDGLVYLKTGEEFFEDLLKRLREAKKFILIDLYIFSKSDLLDEVLGILKNKAQEKVEIKIIADDLGSKFRKPKKLEEFLKNNNIEIIFYNTNILCPNRYIAFRDHRKIIVIDSKVAYTGGINIADEYVNTIEKYGYFKDGGIKVYGEAVLSFIVMFGRLYEQITSKSFDYFKYTSCVVSKTKTQGYVMPVEQTPQNNKNAIENMYINAIGSAKDYIYIATPYFIPSESLISVISNAARSGVKISIIVPGVPDKVLVNKATKSFYTVCLEAGIDIYEYRPGFIHSKVFLKDDEFAVCGSINLDYRSFNLNYESAVVTYKTGEELKIKKDFENMINNSNKLDLSSHIKRPFLEKVVEAVSRLFTPII